jgi:hypothetical protein
MSRVGVLALLLAAAVAAAGCGGDSSDEGAIRGVLARLDSARRSGDAKGACSKLIAVVEPEGERDAKNSKGDEQGDADAVQQECESAFRRTLALARTGLRRYSERVEEVEVKGKEAEARARVRVVRTDGSVLVQTARYRFVDRDGWRLAIDRGG